MDQFKPLMCTCGGQVQKIFSGGILIGGQVHIIIEQGSLRTVAQACSGIVKKARQYKLGKTRVDWLSTMLFTNQLTLCFGFGNEEYNYELR